MKLVVATDSSTLILWWRASLLASPTVVPASTVPWRWIAPVRARMASSSVVLPLWNGPTSAMHRGPRGPPPLSPISASSIDRDRLWPVCDTIVSGAHADGKSVRIAASFIASAHRDERAPYVFHPSCVQERARPLRCRFAMQRTRIFHRTDVASHGASASERKFCSNRKISMSAAIARLNDERRRNGTSPPE